MAKAGDDWVSIAVAADLMHCSKTWVLTLLHRGDLVGKRLHSRAWAVSRKSAEANYRDYSTDTSRKVGRPRADNPPAAAARPEAGESVRFARGNNPMVAITSQDGQKVFACDLCTVPTAAEISGFHRSWIHGLISRGKLWSLDIDGTTFVRRADAATLERSNRGRPRKTQSA
jgi:hypothetical protein